MIMSILEKANFIKYLGTYIDKHLTWKEHINLICKKVSKNIGIISKLRHYVDRESCRMVYFSLVYPYLQYGAMTWGSTYKTRINSLHILNNKAVRTITFSHFQAHAPPIYKSLGILQLKDIVFTQIATFMYDYYNSNLPSAFSNYFKNIAQVHRHNTRQSNLNLHLSAVSTNYGKFSLKFSGVKVWNSIDKSVRNAPRKSFIKKVKETCFSTYQ